MRVTCCSGVLSSVLGACDTGAWLRPPRAARSEAGRHVMLLCAVLRKRKLDARASEALCTLLRGCRGAHLRPPVRSMHTANKLATKHERVALSKAAECPQCDICQDGVAALFCADDRALMCRRWAPESAQAFVGIIIGLLLAAK